MAKRKQRVEEERELTRKEIRLRARDRQRNRRLYIGVGIAVGLALLLVVVGAVMQFAVRPNSAIATVGEDRIITRDFWKRMRFEKWQMQNQRAQMQQLQAQFGQNLFASQIAQLDSTLANPFALGVQVLDRMIDDAVIKQQAAARNITVTDAEVDAELRAEIANGRGALSEPQATETAEANTQATATAAGWTPTPSPTPDESSPITATATALPTPEPLATRAIISETGYTEGLAQLTENLSAAAGMTVNEYRELVRLRLLTEKLQESVSAELVTATEEQAHARHILIAIREPTPEATGTLTATETTPLTATTPLTNLFGLTPTQAAADKITATEEITSESLITVSHDLTGTAEISATREETSEATLPARDEVTTTAALVDSAGLTVTDELTAAANLTSTSDMTATADLTGISALTAPEDSNEVVTNDPNAPRTEAEALARAEEVRRRLLAGEDFAALALEYSDDLSNASTGGDLGWFGRDRMVPEFEEAAFSTPLNEVSEPIKTQFGYHLIEVLERDANRPKDENQLQQERQQVFQTWLQEQKTAIPIERPQDLQSLLPTNL